MLPDAALLLQQQDSARLSIDVVILVLELLLGLVHLGGRLHHLLHHLLQPRLQLLHPLARVADVRVEPVALAVGVPDALLQVRDLGVHVVTVKLKSWEILILLYAHKQLYVMHQGSPDNTDIIYLREGVGENMTENERKY